MMKLKITCFIMIFLMLILSLSVATNSLNDEVEVTNLDEASESWNVIQSASIITESTLSSGGRHTCVIISNGTISCWGDGVDGQLGHGEWLSRKVPTQTSSLGNGRIAVAISSGHEHTCAILDNGAVSCWGDNTKGQLGNGMNGILTSKKTPILISSLGSGRTAVAISSGHDHTCAILDNGSVSCWGRGSQGQLGNGNTDDKNTPTLTSSIGINRTAIALSSGDHHTCVILDNGAVSCWGDGNRGQIGNGEHSEKLTPTLTSSLGVGRTAIALNSGGEHTCAILDDSSVSCWGKGNSGMLGNGDNSDKYTPTLTSSLGTGRTAVAISSGGGHTCAILDNSSVSCWGGGNSGRLGNGDNSDKYTPTLTSSLGTNRTAIAVSSGRGHTCVILDNSSVSCWGDGNRGQIGNGDDEDRYTPTWSSSIIEEQSPKNNLFNRSNLSGFSSILGLVALLSATLFRFKITNKVLSRFE
jgi:alpha-tubulin suppressor-like RCC1 family protein